MRTNQTKHDAAVIDPVCGQPLHISEGTIRHDFLGHAWHFCSGRCRDLFVREAARIHVAELSKMGALLTGQEKVRWGRA
jgi:YHS domain-containing protein